ncbi:MAG TPA: tyrosine-protein phosphatase [Propionicimonas sp.]|jgi:protein-tyrosine phosphatase
MPSGTVVAGTPSPSASASAKPSASASPTLKSPPPAASLQLSSITNFRDVAGEGLALPGGKQMATGVVYRSATLKGLSAKDAKELRKAGVGEVIDLRTDYVAAQSPDPAIKGVAHHVVNIFAVTRTTSVRYRTVAAAQAHMRQMNVDFVDVAAQRRKIAQALTLIAAADAPVLFHCTEGKDRSGWISALLQLTAGASRAEVTTEYLKSNDFRAELIDAAYRAKLTSSGRTAADVERALMKVRSDYLGAGLDELKARYGDIDGYLSKGLGLSAAAVQRLRDRLTA